MLRRASWLRRERPWLLLRGSVERGGRVFVPGEHEGAIAPLSGGGGYSELFP